MIKNSSSMICMSTMAIMNVDDALRYDACGGIDKQDAGA